jgi:hypothetical protein
MGSQGGGKTTFLSGLYSYIESEFAGRSDLCPLYINLSEFIHEQSVEQSIRSLLRQIESEISEDEQTSFVLMVDGLNERDKNYSVFLTRRILEDFQLEKIAAIIWSISDNFDKQINELIKEINPNRLSFKLTEKKYTYKNPLK